MSVCHSLDPRFYLRKMDILYRHGGLIGYWNSNLDIVFLFTNIFCLHAILYYAGGAIYPERGSEPRYSYVFGRETKSCFLGSEKWAFFTASGSKEVYLLFSISPTAHCNHQHVSKLRWHLFVQ